MGFDCTVILPATHDTGSAFIAVPATNSSNLKTVTISSGTWSLLGVETASPITTEESRLFNFSNEGGYDFSIRYLKNIMGLWMIQSLRREFNQKDGLQYSFSDLINMAKSCSDFKSVLNVNDTAFFSPESMTEAIQIHCKQHGQLVPQKHGEILQCVYRGLAESYAESIKALESITGNSYETIRIVGGGSQDAYLNTLTANRTGLPVFAGPTEGTALGNIVVQMIAAGEYKHLEMSREAILKSFDIRTYGVNI